MGCQMNDHDSERISGLLEADGLVRAESESDADVVVLNTCCIRENADNKLYGNLGHLKTWKGKREGRQIVVSGCLAQKDQELVAQKAAHVDVVMGTHNVHRAAELLEESKSSDVPITEILAEAVIDDHAMFPSALPARRETSYNAWLTIQIGCDNNCAFCIVPAVRGSEISRPYADIIAEAEQLATDGVTEVTLLGQNVNSYGRDLQLAARQSGETDAKLRPLFSQLLRDVGMAISPFNAFMFLQGLETLSLRMERHWSNAQKVAEFLDGHDQVESVNYSGLPSSPWHERAKELTGGMGYGSVLAFEIQGGHEAGKKFVEGLSLHSHVANIGDARSLVIHPGSTTHSQLNAEEQAASAVTAGLVRLSVGLESIDDIVADLEAGFAAAR